MEKRRQGPQNNWVITLESSRENHQSLIRSAVAKRAYQLFEDRGHKYGMDLDDWIAAEKELLIDDFGESATAFRIAVEYPSDPEVTTILSLTTHSLVVLRTYAHHDNGAGNGPHVESVYIMRDEIDPARAEVKSANRILHVTLPKKTNGDSSAYEKIPK